MIASQNTALGNSYRMGYLSGPSSMGYLGELEDDKPVAETPADNVVVADANAAKASMSDRNKKIIYISLVGFGLAWFVWR